MKSIISFLLIGLFASAALATPEAIQSKIYIDLRDHAESERTFLQTMLLEEEGIIAAFDKDYTSEYTFGSWEDIDYALSNFDDKNRNRVLRMFDWDRDELREFTEELEGQTFTPETVSDLVGEQLRRSRIRGADKYALGQFYAIASKGGVLIRINEDNYYYNIGYYHPEVRSGRSYGATPEHNANDASHLMYLRQLKAFLSYENDYRQFYQGIMDFLTDTDVSVFDDPSFNIYGEAVLSDYITVYTAELRRQVMRGLNPRSAPWGNDMSEATFLSLYNVKSGLMNLEEGLVESGIEEHWAMSKVPGSKRSGFGINRRYRRSLQRKISNYFRYHENEEQRIYVAKIDSLIGKRRDGDIYRGVMEFLNHKRNFNDKDRVENVEEELVEAFVNFIMQVYENTAEVTEAIN